MKRRETPLIKVPLMIPRRKALALVAAGSHYSTNFDADSARQAARASGQFAVNPSPRTEIEPVLNSAVEGKPAVPLPRG